MNGWNTSSLLGWPIFRGELLVLGSVYWTKFHPKQQEFQSLQFIGPNCCLGLSYHLLEKDCGIVGFYYLIIPIHQRSQPGPPLNRTPSAALRKKHISGSWWNSAHWKGPKKGEWKGGGFGFWTQEVIPKRQTILQPERFGVVWKYFGWEAVHLIFSGSPK